jgi:hypothetical protein
LTVHRRQYVEIKDQLDAKGWFFSLQNLLFAQHVLGHHYAHHQELKSYNRWLLPVVLDSLAYRLLVWCRAVGCVSGLRDAGRTQTGPKTHSSPHQTNDL